MNLRNKIDFYFTMLNLFGLCALGAFLLAQFTPFGDWARSEAGVWFYAGLVFGLTPLALVFLYRVSKH